MFFFTSFVTLLFQSFQILLHSPLLCLRTGHLLRYLLRVKAASKFGSLMRTFKAFQYLYLIVCCLRAQYLAFFLASGRNPVDLLLYDPLASLAVHKYRSINPYSCSVMGMLVLYALHVDYTLFFKMDYTIIQMASDLLVSNVEACYTVDGQVGNFPLTSRPFWRLLRCRALQIRRIHFTGSPFRYLSRKLRIHLVRKAILSETIVWVGNAITGSSGLFVWGIHLWFIWLEAPPASRFHALLDLTIGGYCAYNAFRATFFGVNLVWMIRCLFTGYLTELTCNLAARLEAYQKKPSVFKREALVLQLRYFTSEHARFHNFARHLNSQALSGYALAGFLTVTLANQVLFNLLLFKDLQWFEQTLLLYLLLIQIVVTLIACDIIIAIAMSLYQSESLLYRVQRDLKVPGHGQWYSRQILSTKLHLMSFYEVICTRKPFTFTVGSLGKVTKKSLFEFILGYSSFFMYLSKFLRKLKL